MTATRFHYDSFASILLRCQDTRNVIRLPQANFFQLSEQFSSRATSFHLGQLLEIWGYHDGQN